MSMYLDPARLALKSMTVNIETLRCKLTA